MKNSMFGVIKSEVAKYFNERRSKGDSGQDITVGNVIIVWYCYILGGWKALATTDVQDGMYYEVTFDKQKSCLYIDAYKRWENVVVEL